MAIILLLVSRGVKFARHVIEVEGQLLRLDGGRDRRPGRLIRIRGLRSFLRRRFVRTVGNTLSFLGVGFRCDVRFGRVSMLALGGRPVLRRFRRIGFPSGSGRRRQSFCVHLVACYPVEFLVGEVFANLLASAALLHDDLRCELALR